MHPYNSIHILFTINNTNNTVILASVSVSVHTLSLTLSLWILVLPCVWIRIFLPDGQDLDDGVVWVYICRVDADPGFAQYIPNRGFSAWCRGLYMAAEGEASKGTIALATEVKQIHRTYGGWYLAAKGIW